MNRPKTSIMNTTMNNRVVETNPTEKKQPLMSQSLKLRNLRYEIMCYLTVRNKVFAAHSSQGT